MQTERVTHSTSTKLILLVKPNQAPSSEPLLRPDSSILDNNSGTMDSVALYLNLSGIRGC